jgi:N-acetylglutamate synthase-like GNAT family acetyltransferase
MADIFRTLLKAARSSAKMEPERRARVVEDAAFAIRKASNADAAGILQCLAEAFEPYRESYTVAGFLDTILTPETLEQRLKSMTILVAVTHQGMVVGTVAYSVLDREEGHLRGMAVRSSWHGTGLAQQLLDRAESELRAIKCSRISLDTTAPLLRAMRFYERNGFRRSGKTGDFFGMPLFEYVKP